MLHGRPVRPPAVGATLISVDESSIKDLPGIVKVVTRKNYVGVVAEKPWQAIQAAQPAAGDLDGRHRPAESGAVLRLHAEAADARHAGRRLGRRGREAEGAAARSVRATYMYPFQMHGVDRQLVRRGRRAGGKATVWAASQNVYALRGSSATLLGVSAGHGPRRLHARIRAATASTAPTPSRSTRRSVAGGRQARSRAALAQGRNGVGELRTGVRRRPARRPRRAGQHHRVGLRRMVGLARRPSGRASGQRGERVPHGLRAGALPAADAVARADRVRRRQQHRAVVRRRQGRRQDGRAPDASRASACCRTASSRRSSTDRCARRSSCRTRSRTSRFMDEVAARVKADPVAYRLRHLSDPRLIDVVRAAAKRSGGRRGPRRGRATAAPASRPAAGSRASRATAATAGSRWRRTSTSTRTPARSSSDADDCRAMRVRSRIPTASATSSKARALHGIEPCARRRSHLGRTEGDGRRLADLSHADARDRRCRPSRRS